MYDAMRDAIFTLNNPNAPRLCPELAAEIGLNESILLLQIEFWIRLTPKERDGKLWTYQSVRDLQKFFSFWGLATINRTVKSLEDKKLVYVANYNQAKYDRTRWFALNFEECAKIKSIRVGGYDTQSAQNGTPSNQNGTQSTQDGTTIPESTTDTTTEKESTISDAPASPTPTPPVTFENLKGVTDDEITQAKSAHRQMLSALSEVCQIDLSLCAGKYGKEASRLVKAGYTWNQVRQYYGIAGEWYRYDWRGQKGQPPDIRAINETIQRAVSGAWKEGGGTRENPGVAFAKRHGLMEDEHGDGRGSIEGVFTVSDDLSRSGIGERYRPGRNARGMADGVG